MNSLVMIIVGAALVNNVVLSQFLGICSFLGVSKQMKASLSLGGAVIFVITIASAVASLLYTFVLEPLRGIAWLYNETEKSMGRVVSEYAARKGCSEETAEQYLTVARLNHNQVSLYVTAQDEDGEETGEDVIRDDSWDYTAILWNDVRAKAVQAAFEKLTYREQRLLEERNAICMTCGRVSPLSEHKSFEELAVMFEGSTASGAERAYRKAVEKLIVLLMESGALHAVRLKRKSVKRAKKKIAAAVYEYQADCDGGWGEIQFDFENGTAEIIRLAEWDTMVSKMFAERVAEYIRSCDTKHLPQKLLFPF